MLKLAFERKDGKPLSVLCLGAHSDDIEVGCGGTVLRLLVELPGANVHWIVLGASGERAEEAVASANLFLRKAGQRQILVEGFRDGFFPYIGGEIKDYFERLKGEVSPDLILTHARHDLHQDHRLVSELTWNTFRDHMILEYEVVKYDGDLGAPNLFVRLPEEICLRKARILMECFRSQRARAWFTEDTFLSMLRIRGVECNAPERYAEAFYCRKAVL